MMTPPTPLLRPMDAELDGYAWLPRLIDKSRAAQAGTLGGIVHPCPVDRRCLLRLGIDFERFTAIVAVNPTDDEVLAALRAHGIAPAAVQWFDAVAFEEQVQRAA